ncbi:MAG: flavodoxin family protein [Dehalococcoidales bacterium]|nr:flavodoxin family protein [Dehalococcoidales bacterium]
MKVVGIVCSPRRGGNTEILVREALDTIQESGGTTELITISGRNIAFCDGCRTCVEKGICHINDDMQEICQKLLECDGLILGTPVYFANVTAQAKAIMDRLYVLFSQRRLRGKVAGAIVIARRVGAGQVLSLLYSYFLAHRMYVAGGSIGYGRDRGDVKDGVGGGADTTALGEARNLGRAIISLHEQLSK